LSKPRKLDIFAALRAIDRHDFNWLATQPQDARQEFAPLVVMRWVSGVSDGAETAYMIWLVNDRLNHHLFDLEPDLCFRLLASCGLGKSLRYNWIKGPSRTIRSNLALALLAEHHPLVNEAELRMLLSMYSREQFAQFVADCGIPQAKDHMKAYDDALA
jgi:hypothetical protein